MRTRGREGVKNPENFAYVINGSPLNERARHVVCSTARKVTGNAYVTSALGGEEGFGPKEDNITVVQSTGRLLQCDKGGGPKQPQRFASVIKVCMYTDAGTAVEALIFGSKGQRGRF